MSCFISLSRSLACRESRCCCCCRRCRCCCYCCTMELHIAQTYALDIHLRTHTYEERTKERDRRTHSHKHTAHCVLPYLCHWIPDSYMATKEEEKLNWLSLTHILPLLHTVSERVFVYMCGEPKCQCVRDKQSQRSPCVQLQSGNVLCSAHILDIAAFARIAPKLIHSHAWTTTLMSAHMRTQNAHIVLIVKPRSRSFVEPCSDYFHFSVLRKQMNFGALNIYCGLVDTM